MQRRLRRCLRQKTNKKRSNFNLYLGSHQIATLSLSTSAFSENTDVSTTELNRKPWLQFSCRWTKHSLQGNKWKVVLYSCTFEIAWLPKWRFNNFGKQSEKSESYITVILGEKTWLSLIKLVARESDLLLLVVFKVTSIIKVQWNWRNSEVLQFGIVQFINFTVNAPFDRRAALKRRGFFSGSAWLI